MFRQEPISRHQSGDRTKTGHTTMIPRSNLRKTMNLDDGLNIYFRHHARAGPRMREKSGTLGSGEDGNVTGVRLGSDPATWSPHSGGALGHPDIVGRRVGGALGHPDRVGKVEGSGHPSFGTADTKRRVIDLIEDIGENKARKRGESRVREAIDLVETMRRPKHSYGGKVFHSSPCWKRGNCV